jgi:hypothetical protein
MRLHLFAAPMLFALAAACGRDRRVAADPAHRADSAAAPAPARPPAPPAPAAAAAPAPGSPLGDADFVVGPLSDQQDSAAVKAALGRPDSVRMDDNALEPGDSLVTYLYPAVRVLLSGGQVLGITLIRPNVATARGLRVGDPEARVHELYGEGSRYERTLEFNEGDVSTLHLIRVELEKGRVTQIYVGAILD